MEDHICVRIRKVVRKERRKENRGEVDCIRATCPSGLRVRFAKPLFVGSNPTVVSNEEDELSDLPKPLWWNGRHASFKNLCLVRAGSSPVRGTKDIGMRMKIKRFTIFQRSSQI